MNPTSLFNSPLRWMRLTTYCEISGDSADAVHARRRKRQWTDGIQCKIGPDGNLWVNPEEVNRWIEQSPPGAQLARAGNFESRAA